MRSLAQLDRAETPSQDERPSSWGLPQGLAFLGLVTVAAGLFLGAYGYATRPRVDAARTAQELQNTSPAETWLYWQVYRDGIPNRPTPESVSRHQQAQAKWRWVIIGGGIALVGLLVAASGLLVTPPPRPGGKAG